MNARLAELLDAEGKLARTDPLTGVWNRRAFLERLHDELARARRAGSAVCIAALDLDNFKRVNDRFGHPEGDAFLKQVAEALRETIRASDVAARLGGDEFFVLFPDASRDAVESIAHRLVARLRALGAQYDGLDVGASVGMAWFDSAPETAEIAIARTDHALQDAKSAGKHRLLLWTSDAERAIARP
jgi:diguanylate cyclase